MEYILDVKNVSKNYGGVRRKELPALKNINMSVRDGECICLMGPSGCGKSTLLNLIAGFIAPTTGEVLLDGKEVQGPGPDRGMVFQQPTLYDWQNVADNISFGLRMRKFEKAKVDEITSKYVELTGLSGFERFAPYELSGGMKQRVALARVLAGDPRVLLMDEPFSALDPATRQDMQNLLADLMEKKRRTVILVTHDISEALFLADRIIIFTKRPGEIKDEIDLSDVNFTDRRNEIIERPDMTALHRKIMHSVTDG